jgi:hypothetical protein
MRTIAFAAIVSTLCAVVPSALATSKADSIKSIAHVRALVSGQLTLAQLRTATIDLETSLIVAQADKSFPDNSVSRTAHLLDSMKSTARIWDIGRRDESCQAATRLGSLTEDCYKRLAPDIELGLKRSDGLIPSHFIQFGLGVVGERAEAAISAVTAAQ